MKSFLTLSRVFVFSTIVLSLATGCQTNSSSSAPSPAPAPAAVAAPAAPPVVTAPVPPAAPMAVRIKAGGSAPFTDTQGNAWLADQGFNGGDVAERPDVAIAKTTQPEIYRSERYSMDSFSWPLPNGKYLVKLHFCETFDGITGAGQRVFSFNVQGREFKDYDVFAKAGGPLIALVESVPVEIKDGKLLITFTPNIENPQINGIEIIPQP